jgi:ribosome-interacting GTPase 1
MRFTHNISNIESNVALAMSQSSICEKPIPKYKEILKILIVNGHVDTKKELEQGEYYTEATKKLVIELTELREVVNKLFLEPDDSSTCVLIGGMETINHQEKEEIISKLAKIKMQDACLEIQNSQTKEQLQKSLCKRQIFSKALDILNEININLSECAKEMHKILDECCGLQGPVLSLFALAASKVPSDSIQTLQTDIQEIVAALPQALHYQEAIDILDIPGAELIGDDYTSES